MPFKARSFLRHATLVAAALQLLSAPLLIAQTPTTARIRGPAASPVWTGTGNGERSEQSAQLASLSRSISAHRVRGALIGAALWGATVAVIGNQLCEAHEDRIKTTVLFGLMGATVGAVVGGMVVGDGKQERAKLL
jgi:hypothetical protein